MVAFVDDLRLTGFSIENAWAAARHILSRLQYLGIQDAPRKRNSPSQRPGAWAGAIFKISPENISVSVSPVSYTPLTLPTQTLLQLSAATGPLQ